jgi:hypothetical protein
MSLASEDDDSLMMHAEMDDAEIAVASAAGKVVGVVGVASFDPDVRQVGGVR